MPPPPDILLARLRAAQNGIGPAAIGGLLVTSPVNLRYLTGVAASAGMALVTPDGVTVNADQRYVRQFREAAAVLDGVSVVDVPVGQSYEATAATVVAAADAGLVLGVEADHLTVGRLAGLRAAAGMAGREIRETSGFIEALRAIKDVWELGRLREAGGRLAEVAACILPEVSDGRSEREVSWKVELALHAAGFERPAFETIVASGPNAARPHHRPGDRRIAAGELVVVDFGGVLDGYAVDMTRTVAVGAVPAELASWVRAVAEAQTAAIEATGPGVLPSAIDGAARAVLARHGLAEAFVHGTGHGLGLEVHERPTIGPRGDGEGPVVAGMVFTVEPGVYVADRGGVRIEDDIVVTLSGVERLTSAPSGFEAHEL